VNKKDDTPPTKRQYPPLYERIIPIALIIIAIAIAILLLITVGVVVGVFPGSR
jgi:hypothetical protein